MDRRFVKTGAILGGLVVIAWMAKALLLQGLSVTTLGTAPPTAAAVSQSLGLSASRTTLPVIDEDYSLQDVRYFQGNEWAVATVAPTKPDADTVLIVMKKIGGTYQPVLGPGVVFSSSYVYTLPPDVSQYLNKRGALNG